MKKRKTIVPVLLCVAALMTACGEEKAAETSSLFETMDAETQSQKETSEQPAEPTKTETAVADTDVITEDQAYSAVINYNKAIGSGIDGEINSEGYSEYWDVSTNDEGKIVVLYRSYTGAQTYYYVDPASGETYVTELVPGIIDEEQETGEKFNARDYLTATQAKDDQTADNSSSVSVENETSDGFMGSFLLASDRDMIDTTNDYGELYRVIYEASVDGDDLIACGSMDYRNSKDQDPITISSDVKHVFKVDENTVYLKGGEEGTDTISKEDFAELLDVRKDSGMYFEVEISGGVVKTATLFAQ